MKQMKMTLREQQRESARVLAILPINGITVYHFNNKIKHDSRQWYSLIIDWYVAEFGDLPSKCGPAQHVNLIGDE
jgi:hypothetical protein